MYLTLFVFYVLYVLLNLICQDCVCVCQARCQTYTKLSYQYITNVNHYNPIIIIIVVVVVIAVVVDCCF